MTQAFSSNYNIKLLVQLDMASSHAPRTESTDASELLMNTLYEVHNVKVSEHHLKMRGFADVPIQHSVSKAWKFIERGNMKHSLSDIPKETRTDVQKLLRQPLQAIKHGIILPCNGLLCNVTHAFNTNDDMQSVHVGASDVQINNTTLKTDLKTLHIKHKCNDMHLTLTAVMVPASNQVHVFAQHFVQLDKQMPVRAKEVLAIYGKCMKSDAIRINATCSHKMNRDALRNNHVLLCKELGLTTTPKTTNCTNNVLYHTFVTTTNQNSNLDVCCLSVYT
tara:strand:- start:465 stop:1298 length:834 start_codon:yes stop_codon:yes gene_type:complete